MNQILVAAGRLRDAPWLRRPETQAIFTALDGDLGHTRAVGGVVRDTILERLRDDTDIDMATVLLPDAVMARAEAAGMSVYPTGIEHGTVTVKCGETLAEVTTLRRDVETDGRRAVVAFGTDWSEDAQRRDFTLNALYVRADGTLEDPIGGLPDCLAGRIRFIGEARRRIAEDGLRVFRFFRFSASHGGQALDEQGFSACAAAAGTLGHISAERIGFEMRRMLDLPQVSVVLRAMAGIGIIGIDDATLDALSLYEKQADRPGLLGRLALLFQQEAPEIVQARWRLSKGDIAAALSARSAARLLMDMKIDEAIYRHAGELPVAVDLAALHMGWTRAAKAAIKERADKVGRPVFPISGKDLQGRGFPPGPRFGQELGRLEKIWIESEFALDRDGLLGLIEN